MAAFFQKNVVDGLPIGVHGFFVDFEAHRPVLDEALQVRMGLGGAWRAGSGSGHADEGGAQAAAQLEARPVVHLGDARFEASSGLGSPWAGEGRTQDERHENERAQKGNRFFHPRLIRFLWG